MLLPCGTAHGTARAKVRVLVKITGDSSSSSSSSSSCSRQQFQYRRERVSASFASTRVDAPPRGTCPCARRSRGRARNGESARPQGRLLCSSFYYDEGGKALSHCAAAVWLHAHWKAGNKPDENAGRAKAWLWLALELERWPARLQHAEHGTAEGTNAEL